VYEYQAPTLEVEVFESAEMLLFKLSCCFESSLVDFGVEGVDVGGTFLQGDGAVGYEIHRRHYRSGWWLEISGFSYVKGEYGVSSCDSEVW
jgi:hypothetical protein